MRKPMVAPTTGAAPVKGEISAAMNSGSGKPASRKRRDIDLRHGQRQHDGKSGQQPLKSQPSFFDFKSPLASIFLDRKRALHFPADQNPSRHFTTDV
jgi:hypothetical protein